LDHREQSGCDKVVPIGDNQTFSDAILEAFKKRESLPVKGMKGRKYIETNYSKKAIAHKYHELIMELQY
jgi:glycosyltransferase involved in cell wall biosynthesis